MGHKVAPFSEKYRKVMGRLCGFTQAPSYSTWDHFRQVIIKGISVSKRNNEL